MHIIISDLDLLFPKRLSNLTGLLKKKSILFDPCQSSFLLTGIFSLSLEKLAGNSIFCIYLNVISYTFFILIKRMILDFGI